MSLATPTQTQMTKVAQTKCDLCSRETGAAAPLAERWYWQSDGGNGLFVLCTDCVKNWRHSER